MKFYESGEDYLESILILKSEISEQLLFRNQCADFPEEKNSLAEIHDGRLYFCLEKCKVCMDGQEIELTAKEFDDLYLLLLRKIHVPDIDWLLKII